MIIIYAGQSQTSKDTLSESSVIFVSQYPIINLANNVDLLANLVILM